MKIFVTVGTTKFDELIEAIDRVEFIDICKENGFDHIRMQIGGYKGEIKNVKDYVNYVKPTEMNKEIENADLVIGHAGAGTIIEVKKKNKPLIVVVNDSLMDNHQIELATKLDSLGIVTMTSVSNFAEVFKNKKYLNQKPLRINTDLFVKKVDEIFGL